MYQHRDYPEKSWSASKLESFYSCKRQYYFNAYGHWNGWEFDADERTKQIYRLKKIQNCYTLSGQLLHEQIKNVFNYRVDNPQTMLTAIRTSLNDSVKNSIHKKSYWQQKPNRLTMLHEYYYGKGINKQLGNQIIDRMKTCLTNFFKSDIYHDFKAGTIKIIENEEQGFPHFTFNDYKIYCILDMLYKKGDNYYIVDWKTGKPAAEENRRQMVVYALYVLSQYQNISLANIKGINKYLLSGETIEYNFTSEDVVDCRDMLENSITKMENYLENKEQNQPKNELVFEANVGRHCKMCNFVGICQEAQATNQVAVTKELGQ
ncbi:PD-(D/E)XK nuclease family protein [Clostridium sp. 'deep sea']|uniref:PD-(D/E)XK nuclease family protein n=1 Tax=Clostridium sp. 'deep sea' TaxID=2779445 RepID=UPI0018969451|nr:PD-(D/E)XK nuclease family protein [Clostridium sp. 'deep sea']QOR34667.1 PD-(D/E)XK nuclease family protein [Clostridium sp. 'deep sea']